MTIMLWLVPSLIAVGATLIWISRAPKREDPMTHLRRHERARDAMRRFR